VFLLNCIPEGGVGICNAFKPLRDIAYGSLVWCIELACCSYVSVVKTRGVYTEQQGIGTT